MTPRDRHSRHRLFQAIGDRGQRAIARARVAVVGCGALGSHAAEMLGRAGVATAEPGILRLIDRDYVEESNLQRQAMYDTADAASSRPKSAAAVRHLTQIDPAIRCEAAVRDLNPGNALDLLRGVDLIIDGTDNFRTRFIINDAAIANGVPWIYGAAVGSRGMTATIVPGRTPCLRCLLGQIPPFGAAESCDTAGIITPLPSMVASMQVAAALRLIVSGEAAHGLTSFDAWAGGGSFRTSFGDLMPDPGCSSCGTRELPALKQDAAEQVVTLCGRNSVQLFASTRADLDAVERQFANVSTVRRHRESVTAEIPEGWITLFDDGRVIVEGTTDPLEAKSIVARYLGG